MACTKKRSEKINRSGFWFEKRDNDMGGLGKITYKNSVSIFSIIQPIFIYFLNLEFTVKNVLLSLHKKSI